MIPELLERAAKFFRLGMHAMGCVSWRAYEVHKDRVMDAGIDEVRDAIARGDYILAADAIDYGISKLLTRN